MVGWWGLNDWRRINFHPLALLLLAGGRNLSSCSWILLQPWKLSVELGLGLGLGLLSPLLLRGELRLLCLTVDVGKNYLVSCFDILNHLVGKNFALARIRYDIVNMIF